MRRGGEQLAAVRRVARRSSLDGAARLAPGRPADFAETGIRFSYVNGVGPPLKPPSAVAQVQLNRAPRYNFSCRTRPQ